MALLRQYKINIYIYYLKYNYIKIFSLNYIQSNAVVTLPNQAAIIIYASDSGKTLLVPAQGVASVVTMPALQADLRYRF